MNFTVVDILTFIAAIIVPIIIGVFDYKRKKAETEKLYADKEVLQAKLSETAINAATISINAQTAMQLEINGLRTTVNQMRALLDEIPELKTKVSALEKEREGLKDRVVVLEEGILELMTQIHALGGTPLWTPPSQQI